MEFGGTQEQIDIFALRYCSSDLMVGTKMMERVFCPMDVEVQKGGEMVRRGSRKQ